jgi:hypothetical protein
MATADDTRRPILVPNVPELEIRRLDEFPRALGVSRAALLRKMIRDVVAAVPPLVGSGRV